MQIPKTFEAKLLDLENEEIAVPKPRREPTGDPLTDIFGSWPSSKQIDPFLEFMNNSNAMNQSVCESENSVCPNYSRSLFETSSQSTPPAPAPQLKANKVKVKEDHFSDLLTGMGFKTTKSDTSLSNLLASSKKGLKKEEKATVDDKVNKAETSFDASFFDLLESIKVEEKKENESPSDTFLFELLEISKNEEKREEKVIIQKDKFLQWKNGREKDIRALLLHLDEVLWASTDKWHKPTITDLVDSSQIKKYHRKASIIVHPDKYNGTPYESLAHDVSSQLNFAWLAYKKEHQL